MNSYEIVNNKTFSVNEEGERKLLANFSATITEEIRYADGASLLETYLTIVGKQTNPKGEEIDLPEVAVSATAFPSMAWVVQNWGVRAVVQPGGSVKEDLRTAIQMASDPKITTVYKSLGWTKVKGKDMFVHAGGGIGANGNDPSIQVQLPQELSRYDLKPDPTIPLRSSILATLALTKAGPPELMWTLLAATFAPALGPVDFAIHVTGRSGTFKSEVISLFQSHYGAGMDARHLPGSWSSTANALEAQAHYARNAPFVVDDFVPTGTSWQVRAYQTTADKLIRAQGNQSGRARLTDTSNLQSTMYPRGIILSTGEDTPDGHSVRARMMILEMTPGDIDPVKLTGAQADRKLYPGTTAGFIQWIAQHPQDLTPITDKVRSQYLDIGHTRTPSMLGRLIATLHVFFNFVEDSKVLPLPKVNELRAQAGTSIVEAAARQQSYLEATDPCDLFTATIRQMFASGLGHVRTLSGGIPKNATALGWTSEDLGSDIPTFKSRGPCVGWVNWKDGEIYLDVTAGFAIVKKVAGSEMQLTKQTMLKRLKDSGHLTRTDETRQRNTVRVTAENHPRQVLCLSIQQVLDTMEGQDDE